VDTKPKTMFDFVDLHCGAQNYTPSDSSLKKEKEKERKKERKKNSSCSWVDYHRNVKLSFLKEQ
jgi:hypothetical protein